MHRELELLLQSDEDGDVDLGYSVQPSAVALDSAKPPISMC